MTTIDWQPLQRHLTRPGRVALAVHEKPDGDALGSMLALAEHLEAVGHRVTRFSVDGVPPSYAFLPGSDQVTTEPPYDVDVIALLDIGDVTRARLPLSPRGVAPMVLVIDHHPTRLEHTSKDVVDGAVIATHVSSTCELVFHFLQYRQARITKSMATNLLTGISTDTGTFQNAATTGASLAVAAHLLLRGASLPKVIAATYRNKSVAALRLWGRALERLKHDPETGQVTTLIRQQDLRECGVDDDAAEGVSNFLNSLAGARLTLFLKEEPDGRIRGSYRTTRDDVDVAALAARYGGGGHRKAAGFTAVGPVTESTTSWELPTPPSS